MGFGELAVKRSRARSRLLTAIFAIMALIAFALTTMVGYVDSAQTSAVREELLAAPEASTAVQLRTLAGADQEAEATGLIIKSFAPGTVDVHRTVRTTDFTVKVAGTRSRVSAGANPALTRNASLVEGTWPTFTATAPGDPLPVAIHAKAAEKLGLSPGDTIGVTGTGAKKTSLVVAATWLPADAIDRSWFGDPGVATGFNGRTAGPLILAEDDLARLPIRSEVRLTVVPTVDRVSTRELPGLSRALHDVEVGVEDDLVQTEISGDLGARVKTLERAVGASRGLLSVPFALIAIIGFITLTQVARLLASVREGETKLLRARGASAKQLTLMAVWESLLSALPGVVLGSLLAVGVLASTGRAVGVRAALLVAGLTALGAVAVSAFTTWRAALSTLTERSREADNRSTILGATVLVAVAAILSLWQFHLYGSTIDINADGAARVDPLTAFAPLLALLAFALLATFAFGGLASLAEKPLARPRSILPSLPGRQVARRASIFGVAVILITLAVGGATFGALFTDTWSDADTAASGLRNAADVRISLDIDTHAESAIEPSTTAPFEQLLAATSATPVVLHPGSIDRDAVSFMAMSADAIDDAMTGLDGTVETKQLSTSLRAEPPGTEIDDTLDLSLEARAPKRHAAGRIETAAWIADSKGAVARVALLDKDQADPQLNDLVDGDIEVSARVPDGDRPWRVIAIESTLAEGNVDPNEKVVIEVGGIADDAPLSATLTGSDSSIKTLIGQPPKELPVAVTRDLADLFGLDRGDTFDFLIPDPGSSGTAKVERIVSRLPGSANPRAIMADLPTLNLYLLGEDVAIPQANEVWVSSTSPEQTAAEATSVGRYSARVTTIDSESGAALIQPVVTAMRWAAGGAIVLGVLAILAIAAALASSRVEEVQVLRALGLSRRTQVLNRLLELGAVVVLGAGFGILAGTAVAFLTVRNLARGAIPNAVSSVPVPIAFELWIWLLLMTALVVGLAGVAHLYARRVRTELRDDGRGAL